MSTPPLHPAGEVDDIAGEIRYEWIVETIVSILRFRRRLDRVWLNRVNLLRFKQPYHTEGPYALDNREHNIAATVDPKKCVSVGSVNHKRLATLPIDRYCPSQ